MPFVEHLIARGMLVDPTPLNRPFKMADLARALDAVDTLRLGNGERRVVRTLRTELRPPGGEQGPWGRVDVHAGVAAASHARRDQLRPAGPGHGTFDGGMAITLQFGPVTAATHPEFDTRLRYDPDYEGKKDRSIAGRSAEAYLDGQWRYGEVFFGSLDRNWGPSPVDGLLVSPNPYSYDHLAIAVGTTGVQLQGIITQLDDLPDSTGTPNHRYFIAHRLLLRPPGRWVVALWEGNLVAGVGRELEPWYANLLTLGLLTQYDQNSRTNSLLGVDVQRRFGRTTGFASLLLDDIQVDRKLASDREPSSYGATLGAEGGLGNMGWTAYYTRVANLTYRTPNYAETVMRRGVGLGRNFSDYDQLTVRGSVVLGPGLLLAPEATLLRQGEGDFRLPYPAVAAYASTPGFLSGVVERTVRLAAGARWGSRTWSFSADGGVHLVHNAGHVAGRSDTQWVGTVGITYRIRWESPLP